MDKTSNQANGLDSHYVRSNGKYARCALCHHKIRVKDVIEDGGQLFHKECLLKSGLKDGDKRYAIKAMGLGGAVAGAYLLGVGRLASAVPSRPTLGGGSVSESGRFILPGVYSDPPFPLPGQMWYRMDLGITAFRDGIRERNVYSKRVNGYITVSAKGISNGLSNIPNDGADFGPDTLLGASSPNQYGPPYTQTSGIQEAINYVTSLPDTKEIVLLPGTYNITAPFVEYGTAPSWQNPTLPGRYGLINVMPVSISQIKTISICGAVTLPMGSGGSYELISSSSGAIINILTPALTSTTTPMTIYQTLFYVPSGIDIYTSASFQNIIVTQPAPCNIAAYFDGQTQLADSYANNLWVGPTNEYNNFLSGIASTNTKATAYNFNAQMGNGTFCGLLVAQQMYSAFGGNLNHVYIGSLIVQSCMHGIDITEGRPYGFAILGFDVQGTLYPIYFTFAWTATIFIGGWLEEDYTPVAGTTFPTNAEIYISSNAPNLLSLFIGEFLINRNNSTTRPSSPIVQGTPLSLFFGPSVPVNSSLSNVSYKQYLVPTISANPPVSGTVYQNTNYYDIRIYLPVYATTAGTAGSVTIALGSSSTPPTIGTKFINGSTSSSATEIIELVVPMGFYYEFTATGVTFGTATVMAA
ncbi:MAG: hypothetical protein QW292_13305 [Candidatus Parvarchaeota archaeon]